MIVQLFYHGLIFQHAQQRGSAICPWWVVSACNSFLLTIIVLAGWTLVCWYNREHCEWYVHLWTSRLPRLRTGLDCICKMTHVWINESHLKTVAKAICLQSAVLSSAYILDLFYDMWRCICRGFFDRHSDKLFLSTGLTEAGFITQSTIYGGRLFPTNVHLWKDPLLSRVHFTFFVHNTWEMGRKMNVVVMELVCMGLGGLWIWCLNKV